MPTPSLFDRLPISPRDPSVTERESPRLSRQCRAILERLRRGRVTNDELSRIARKYTSRTSDLRAAGHDVRVVEKDETTGIRWYALFVGGREIVYPRAEN